MSSMNIRKQTGFTIVELLIVIVVIGILAAITIVAYNGIQSRATDSTRRSDVNSVRKAIEAEYTQTGQYPLAGNGSSTCLSAPHWACWGFTPETRFVRSEFLQKMPQDPKYYDSAACGYPNSFATRAYYYSVTSDRQGYTVGTFLESVSTNDPNYLAPANRGCGSFMNWGYVKG
jgi:type II secretion system protein G